jgi:hypothetical protein
MAVLPLREAGVANAAPVKQEALARTGPLAR